MTEKSAEYRTKNQQKNWLKNRLRNRLRNWLKKLIESDKGLQQQQQDKTKAGPRRLAYAALKIESINLIVKENQLFFHTL